VLSVKACAYPFPLLNLRPRTHPPAHSPTRASPALTHSPTRVHNILDGLKEQEAILLRTPTFVLLPDSKWDRTTLANLYLTAIAVDGAQLRSLRDLRGSHLDLLRDIRAEVGRFVEARWGLDPSQIRCFIHYQPSYCASAFFSAAASFVTRTEARTPFLVEPTIMPHATPSQITCMCT
jgi:hypothetical protein